MNFDNREEFAEWAASLLDENLHSDDEIWVEFGAYGRCEIIANLSNGDTVELKVSMQDKDFNEK